jgi:hypothetical protein
MTPPADRDEIIRALRVFVEPGSVVELRVPHSRQGTMSGCFNDLDALATAAVRLNGTAPGIFLTMNPVDPALLDRARNRVEPHAKATTTDAQVLRRRWMALDFDPPRPTGISTTDAQHDAALAVIPDVCTWLTTAIGISPESVVTADSGNGSYLFIRVDLPNDAARTKLVKQCLAAVAHVFDSPAVHLDQTMSNAARIVKIFGTVACKGDASAERPHRLSRLLTVPATIVPTDVARLTALAACAPKASRGKGKATAEGGEPHPGRDFDVRAYLDAHGHTIKQEKEKSWEGGTVVVLELDECIFDSTHDRGEAAVLVCVSGMLLYKCQHDSCRTKRWSDVRTALEPDRQAAASDPDTRPRINTTARLLDEITAECVAALTAANTPPTVYRRDFTLVHIAVTDDRPAIRPAGEHGLRNRLAEAAVFTRTQARRVLDCGPPLDVVRAILAQRSWPAAIPPIAGITEMPVLRPDGSIVDRPGYDPATRLVYVPSPTWHMPPIPTNPTAADIAAARTRLQTLVEDFPFANPPSAANVLAALFTPVLAPLIASPIPMCVIDKPTPGSGASLLTEVVSLLATGRAAATLTAPTGRYSAEEWHKLITATLLDGSQTIVIDNVQGILNSPALAKAISGEYWKDRKLGGNENVELGLHRSWYVTGNNVRLGDKNLSRRVYWVRLLPHQARPWERPLTDFGQPNLLAHVREQRGALLAASLTLGRAWVLAGCPTDGAPVFGTFQCWADVLSGVLRVAGVTDFLGNQDEVYADLDQEDPGWVAFIAAWYATFTDTPQVVSDLINELTKAASKLRAALPDALGQALEKEKGFARTFGNALRRRKDQVFEEQDEDGHLVRRLRLQKAGRDRHTKAVRWVVQPVEPRTAKRAADRPADDTRAPHAAPEPPPGSPGNGADDPSEPGEDDPLLDLADFLDWPVGTVRYGLTIVGTREAWRRFAQTASPTDRALALAYLNALRAARAPGAGD